MFIIIHHPLYEEPFVTLSTGDKFVIREDKTAIDLKNAMKNTVRGCKSVEFLTHEGARMAGSTNAEVLLSLPYFKVRINDDLEYIVISEKSFSFKNTKYELEGNMKLYFDYCKDLNMSDDDAVVLSKFASEMLDHTKEKTHWTKDEFVQTACHVLVNEANVTNSERRVLEKSLELLKTHREPLQELKH